MEMHKRLQEYSAKCDEIYLNENLKALVAEANKSVEVIEAEELLEKANDFVILDVREPEEFASGFIKGNTVLTIPRGKLEFLAIDKIAKRYGQDIKIVTYCLKGPRGALAAYQLKKLGFTNVKNLKGGILEWLSKGYTIQSYLGELTLK